jgi:succinoglycan biosynthesis transport protein ExoP
MADAEKPKGNETIDYLGILLSRWWLILLGTLVCAVAAAGVSLLLPNEYEASAVLLIAAPQFTTELNPSTLPIQTYQRIVQSKGLMEKVLQNMKSRHAEDFSDTTVEDLLKGCRVEVEAAGKREAEAESPLLLLFARHENPAYAKEMADIWVQEFMALNNMLQKKRTGETDQFVSVQFQEAKAKLIEAEKAVTEFRDTAQVESLKQQIEIMSEQAKYIFGQLEANREELESEKETLATLEERIGAVEIEGKWLGQLPVNPETSRHRRQ